MSRINELCGKHGIVLCYLFGSMQEQGKALLDGADVRPSDPESDIDFAVLFSEPPEDAAKAYALLCEISAAPSA